MNYYGQQNIEESGEQPKALAMAILSSAQNIDNLPKKIFII